MKAREPLSFEDGRCIIIGEVAQAHDGSLGFAHAYIDSIAAAGADAVKFQTHIAAAESTPSEPWRVKFSRQDASRYDYWKRMEFTESQWAGLRQHAEEKGLWFLSSPFSAEAVELLTRTGVSAWKIASGEITNEPMLRQVAATGLPVMMSTGMSPLAEVDRAVAWIDEYKVSRAVMQCTSAYPTSPEQIGLNLLPLYQERYNCPVGLSDHSGTIFPGLAAATLGAQVLEVHVTMSREMFGPDVPSSILSSELRQLVDGVRFIERMRANPVVKDEFAERMRPMRNLFGKSWVAVRALPAGHRLERDDLVLKKPGNGLPAEALPKMLGKVLCRDVQPDQMILEDDLVS